MPLCDAQLSETPARAALDTHVRAGRATTGRTCHVGVDSDMNADLRDLYQEIILDHNRRPRNRGRLAVANREAEGHNPLCGDQVKVTLLTDHGLVQDIAFEGQGCAISTASASLMTEAVKGKSVEEAERIFREFQEMVTETGEAHEYPDLGELEVFQGVREYPVRIKCATLPWHTLHAALEGGEKVSTE